MTSIPNPEQVYFYIMKLHMYKKMQKIASCCKTSFVLSFDKDAVSTSSNF